MSIPVTRLSQRYKFASGMPVHECSLISSAVLELGGFETASAQPGRSVRAFVALWRTLNYLLMLLLLLCGPANAQFVKLIGVSPGEEVQAVETFYILNCSTSGGVGSYTVTQEPSHGFLGQTSVSGIAPGCPTGSPSLPAVAESYTMKTEPPYFFGDFFSLNYILTGHSPSPIYIFIYNSPALAKLLGGFNLPNKKSVAEPIDVASGNVFYSITDYSTAGQNPLNLTRYYNSVGALAPQVSLPQPSSGLNAVEYSPTLANTMGPNWRTTYDRYLKFTSATSITAERPDGQQLIFTLNGTVWTPDSDIDMTLVQSGNQWTLTDSNDTVETYSVAPLLTGVPQYSGFAQLNSIRLRNGYTQTLTFDNSPFAAGLTSLTRLASVTDSYNRTLMLNYNSGLLQSVTTPDGLVITYGYTGGVLTSATYSTSPQTEQQYVYEDSALPSALTGIIDENGGRYATWGYDSTGRGTSSQLGAGANATTIVYTGDTVRSVTNALGVTDTYTMTFLQGIPKVTQIDRAATNITAAATETFTYDSNGYLASQTDWNGNVTTYTNNAHGSPTSINEAVGAPVARNTAITYDSVWVHLPATVATSGVTNAYTYDGSGELLTNTLTDTTSATAPYATAGQTRTWTKSWLNSLLASVQTPNGNTSKFGYDSSGALTSITDALNHVTNITAHSGGGLPETIVDPNGVTTTLTYDGRQRPTSSTVSGTSGTFRTTWAYDAAGNLTTTTLPDGSYLTNAYDTAHRITKVTDALGNYHSYTLDALGDLTFDVIQTKAGTAIWQRTGSFDALGRELIDSQGAGEMTIRTYDQNGNALSVKDSLNHTSQNSYDALNRLDASVDANNAVTTPAYDAHNRIVSVMDANGNVTSYIRNGFGDVVEQISPDSGTSVFYYDSDANLTSKTDALGIVTNQTFDALDRPLTTTYPAHTSENVAYTYDQTGTGTGFGIGRLTSVTDAAGSLTRAYEERGNLASEKRVNGTTTLTTGYTYDGANRVASMAYPDGTLVTYVHDAAGYVSGVSAQLPGSSTATTLATLTHEPFGPLNGVTYGNGIAENWTFDRSYKPTNITDKLAAASLQNLTYRYDLAANVQAITDAVNSANTQTFGYDTVNRLVSAASGTGGYGSFSWSYDKVGNRLTQEQGSTVTTYGYTSGSNRLATIVTSTAKASQQPPQNMPRRRGNGFTAPALVASHTGPSTLLPEPPSAVHSSPSLIIRALGWPMFLIGFTGALGFRRSLRHNRLLAILIASALCTGGTVILIGCGSSLTVSPATVPVPSLALTGRVHGGQQPVTGATIQLYAVGTSGTASASTPLLRTPVQTDTNGFFSITSDYTCPSATTQVYLAATGGNPGLSAGTNNTAIAMMAALGPCGSLSASTYVWVDEVTTIGSLAALYQYMTSVANLGSVPSSATQLASAFSQVSEYTNTATGVAPGPTLPAGYYASSTEIDTLGNIIAACINSGGGTAGDGSACGTLFMLATPVSGTAPTDTIQALLDILKNPTLNVIELFDLSSAIVPFQPSLASAPANWSLPIIGIPPAPTFSVPSGTYTAAQTVSISDTATTASIFYTTDGSAPTRNSNLYTAPVVVASSKTIQAIAVQEPTNVSAIATATYTISTIPGNTVTVLTNANGNITGVPSTDGVSYVNATYNNANRLASVTGTPVAATYLYDWAGQRYSKTDGGAPSTVFSYAQGGTLIAENDGGTVTDYIYVDGRPIAILQPGASVAANQVNYVLADRLGTPQQVVNSAATPLSVWSTTYNPFGTTGTLTASVNQGLRLPGQYADSESGFNYNLNRDYMPHLGRYPESDPVGLASSVNTYSYARNNPARYFDSSGLTAQIMLGPQSSNGQSIIIAPAQDWLNPNPLPSIVNTPQMFQWTIDWNLSQQSQRGGVLIQEVDICSNKGHRHYWEEWDILPGQTRPERPFWHWYDDDYASGPGITHLSITGTARFYEGVEPSELGFQPDANSPAGNLRMSWTPPQLPTIGVPTLTRTVHLP